MHVLKPLTCHVASLRICSQIFTGLKLIAFSMIFFLLCTNLSLPLNLYISVHASCTVCFFARQPTCSVFRALLKVALTTLATFSSCDLELWPLTLAYKFDVDWNKLNHLAEYLGQRLSCLKVIVRTHRHTHSGPIALPGLLNMRRRVFRINFTIHLYNLELKLCQSTALFRRKLKTFLFTASYGVSENNIWTVLCALG